MKLLAAAAISLCLLATGCGPPSNVYSITVHLKDGKELKYDNVYTVDWGVSVFIAKKRNWDVICIVPLDAISWVDEGNTTATRTD